MCIATRESGKGIVPFVMIFRMSVSMAALNKVPPTYFGLMITSLIGDLGRIMTVLMYPGSDLLELIIVIGTGGNRLDF